MRKEFKAEYDRQGAFLGYKETGRIVATADGKPEQVAALMDRIEGAFAPATVEQIELWLAELDQIAPRRAASNADDDLRLRAYTERLLAFPADVAREALLGRLWRFWPSWAELHDVCEELTAQRRAVRTELERQDEIRRERELRARALPTEATATMTAEEEQEQRANRSRALGDLIAEMNAKAAAQEADRIAAQEAAAASYRKSEPPEAFAAE